MNGDWLSAAPSFAVASGLLVVPGVLVIAAGWGFRRLGHLLLAPAVSVAVIAVAAVAAPLAGLDWGLVPVALLTAIAAAIAYVVRRWVGESRPPRPSRAAVAAVVGGIVVAAGIITAQLTYAFVEPESISQTFDAIVHLNSIRYAIDSANASAFHIGDTSDIPFYPNGWHSLVSLTAEMTGASVPVAINSTNIAIGAIAWPASCMALGLAFLGERASAALATAALSTGLGAFPIMLLWFGVLYPNMTGYAILPAGLAAAWLLVRARGGRTVVRQALLLVVVCAGVGLGHPNAFLALFALGGCMVMVQLLIDAIDRRAGRVWLVNGLVAVGVLVIGAALWRYSRTPVEMSGWGPWTGTREAIVQGVLLSPRGIPVPILVCALVAIGIVAAIARPRRLVFAVPFAVSLFMFVLVSGTDFSFFRDMVTNPWYNDSYRLAALLPMGAVPLGALGAVTLVDAGARLGQRMRLPVVAMRATGIVAAAGLFAVGASPNVTSMMEMARGEYLLTDSSRLLTADERALIERLDETTPDDARIAGNPYTGVSLAFALGGREVVEEHAFGARTDDEAYLGLHLRDIDTDPRVCDAVRGANVDYVLDFGSQNVFNRPELSADRSGLDDLPDSESFVLVDSEGDARLLRIEGC